MHFGGRDRQRQTIRKIMAAGTAVLAGVAGICVVISIFMGMDTGKKTENENGILVQWVQKMMADTYMPLFSFLEEDSKAGTSAHFLYDALLSQLPVLSYSENGSGLYVNTEDAETYDKLIRQEGQDEDQKDIEEDSLEYNEDALHIDKDLEKAMAEENNRLKEGTEDETAGEEITEDSMGGTEFAKAMEKTYEYDWSELTAYDDIVSAFYAIDKTTTITDKQINLESLRGKDMKLKAGNENPQILIYHTHSQEDFVDSVPGDESTTIVGAGEYLAQLLREEYGFNVIHHTGKYDVEARDYAYSNSLPEIEKLLAENPTIEVVIDLHRDAVKEGRKLVVDLKGKPTAQFMFFNGLSRTKQNGEISYLENPYIDDNLAFSFQAQVVCNEYYPGVARRIYLKAYRYNMHLRAKSMLVELGAQTNTVEEIINACDPLAHVIATVLTGEEGEQETAGGIPEYEDTSGQ